MNMIDFNILLKPTSCNCNMNCSYCFYRDEAKNRSRSSYGMMSEETLEQIISKTVPQARRSYTLSFQGGEPTLRGLPFFEHAVSLVKKYNRRNVPVSYALQTNGYMLDEAWAEFFRKNGFLVGVSLDGVEKTHDRYRPDICGSPTFKTVERNIDMLTDHGVQTNILTVVNSPTASAVREIYGFYKEKGWRYLQFIACLEPIGSEDPDSEWSLQPVEYGTFLKTLFDLWYEDLLKGEQPSIRQFENYLGILRGYPPESCEQRGVCSVQTVVEADGSVYPCDFYALDEYRIGNFNTDSLSAIQRNGAGLMFEERSMKRSKDCLHCRWFPLCMNGCYRCRMPDTESMMKNRFCESYRSFFEACYPRMKHIALEKY